MKVLDVIFKCNSYFSVYTSGILGFILDRILVTKYSSLINKKIFQRKKNLLHPVIPSLNPKLASQAHHFSIGKQTAFTADLGDH